MGGRKNKRSVVYPKASSEFKQSTVECRSTCIISTMSRYSTAIIFDPSTFSGSKDPKSAVHFHSIIFDLPANITALFMPSWLTIYLDDSSDQWEVTYTKSSSSNSNETTRESPAPQKSTWPLTQYCWFQVFSLVTLPTAWNECSNAGIIRSWNEQLFRRRKLQQSIFFLEPSIRGNCYKSWYNLLKNF